MIIRLWALAWAARYLKYVPILGWRFSDTIGHKIESRMDREVDIGTVTVEFADDAPPTDLRIHLDVTNELPVDLTIAAVNVRVGYAEDARTVWNFLWAADAHGEPPRNLSRSLIESGETETMSLEHYLAHEAPSDTLRVDGTVTTRAWLDVPSTKRVPLGTITRDAIDETAAIPS